MNDKYDDQPLEDAELEARLDAARVWEAENYFGGCPTCCKNDGYLNVYSGNYVVCHEHRVFWLVGTNLFSDWRDETKSDWERNQALLADYQQVEPLGNPIYNGHDDACPRCGALPREMHHPVCRRGDGTPTDIPDHIVRILLEAVTPREVLKALIAGESCSMRSFARMVSIPHTGVNRGTQAG
jgi:hypothetical protein